MSCLPQPLVLMPGFEDGPDTGLPVLDQLSHGQ